MQQKKFSVVNNISVFLVLELKAKTEKTFSSEILQLQNGFGSGSGSYFVVFGMKR
jgi:hypothetical protein